MLSIFLVISLKNTYINKSVTKNISTKYLRRKPFSPLFPLALEDSANLIRVRQFYFKSKFLLERLRKLP